jgi:GLPGLI family protein
MKLLTILLITFSSFCFAQSSGTIYYTKTINDGFSPIQKDINYKIFFKDQKSLELGIPKKDLKSDESFTNVGENEFSKKMIIPTGDGSIKFLYKNYQTNNLLYTDNISIKYYYITDTLDNFNWKITKEREKIQKYNCTKATTTFRGRSYTAWFTEEIPLRFGPWKFGGLPGLIIKLEDDQKHYVYELTGLDLNPLKNDAEVSVPKQYANQSPQTYSSFREIYKTKLSDIEKQGRVTSQNGNLTSTSSRKLPQKMEKY